MDNITAEVFVGAESLHTVVDDLLRLDGPLRPLTVSAGEDVPIIPLDRLDGRRFYLDRISADVGFFLFAPRGTFLFSPLPAIGWKVSVSDILEADAVTLMKAVGDLPIRFAFASEWDELVFLNRANLLLSYGEEEAWVGKDVSKYFPGIYWITVVPLTRVIAWDELMNLARNLHGMSVRRGRFNACIQLYERASDWRDRTRAKKLAKLLDGPIFDKADALAQIDGTEDFLTLSDKLAEWP